MTTSIRAVPTGAWMRGRGMKFADLLSLYLERSKTRGLEPASLKMIGYFTRRFLVPAIGEKELEELTIADFEGLYASMGEKVVPSTVRKCHNVATGALKIAERNEWITRNPARLAELPKNRQIKRNIPTPEELLVFLKAARAKDREIHHFALVMAGTGIRPGEAMGLMKPDLVGNVLTIQRAVDVCQGYARIKSTKTDKVRRLAIDSELAALLRLKPGPFIFGGDTPGRTDLYSKRWRAIARPLAFTFTPRSMRHFHLTQLIANKVDPKTVATRAGHSNPVMTMTVYAQAVPANDDACAEIVTKALALAERGAA